MQDLYKGMPLGNKKLHYLLPNRIVTFVKWLKDDANNNNDKRKKYQSNENWG